MPRYLILGVHGKDVPTVEGNVARVRMYIGDKALEVDEDFDLPDMPKGVIPETVEAYSWLLKDTINARMKALEAALPVLVAADVAALDDTKGVSI